MTEFEKAAVIGYHLSGATIEHIIAVTGCPYWVIERVINDHLKNK